MQLAHFAVADRLSGSEGEAGGGRGGDGDEEEEEISQNPDENHDDVAACVQGYPAFTLYVASLCSEPPQRGESRSEIIIMTPPHFLPWPLRTPANILVLGGCGGGGEDFIDAAECETTRETGERASI